MIKIEGTSQEDTFNYIDNDHYWQYATELDGDENRALIEVCSIETGECVLTISAEIVVDSDELTLIVNPSE